jgi:hypothetical protein
MNKDLRNKLDNYEPAYNPKHWEQLAEKLANANRKRYYWYYILVLLMFLATGFGYWCYNAAAITTNVPKAVENNQKTKKESKVENLYAVLDQKTYTKETEKQNMDMATPMPPKPKETKNEQNLTTAKISNIKKIVKERKTKLSATNIVESKKTSRHKKSNITTPNKAIKPLVNEIAPIVETQNVYHFTDMIRKECVLLPATDTFKPQIKYYDVKQRQETTQNNHKKKWRIGILAMPLFAKWNKSQPEKMTYNLEKGVALAYKLNKIEFGMGLWLSTYSYNTPIEQGLSLTIDSAYTLKTYLSAEQNIQQLFIPLSMRYDLVQHEKYSFFVTVNLLNSFLISDKQQQTTTAEYNFLTTNFMQNQKKTYQQNTQMENNFQFVTALQLQIGYERIVGKHLSYQIEPFFRIGLQPHQLQNYAAGLAMRLNYNFTNAAH